MMVIYQQQIMKNSEQFRVLLLLVVVSIGMLGSFSSAYTDCGFPNQRCLCSGSSVLCRCSQVTSDSNLNFSSTYQSHMLLVAGVGCQPCPPDCLKCSALGNCDTCRDDRYLWQEVAGQASTSRCLPCPTNCQRCSTASICSKCIDGYYLDSKLQCQGCPLEGTKECTVDSLLSCLPNYFLDSNGATCISCASNCQKCASVTKCSVCEDGYYLSSSYKCQKCTDPLCSKCTNSGSTCSSCTGTTNFYSSSTGCASCGSFLEGCAQCSNSSTCASCWTVSGYVLNTQTGRCISYTGQDDLSGCQHASINTSASATTCSKCRPGYYYDSSLKKCRYGCSVVCDECTGAHFGLCTTCSPQSRFELTNLHCLPVLHLDSGAVYQRYFTAMNHGTSSSIFPNATIVSRLANSCLQETILSSNQVITLRLDDLRAFKVSLRFKVYIIGTTNLNNSYTVRYYSSSTLISSSSSQTLKANTSLSIDSNKCSVCNNKTVCIQRDDQVTIDGVINKYGYVEFQAAPQVGLSEVLLVVNRCGGTQASGTCSECSDVRTCTRCVNSAYSILSEKCVLACPNTYYTFSTVQNGEQVKKCYEVCPYGSYPLDSPTNKVCELCPSQCTACSSPSICFSCATDYFLVSSAHTCEVRCPAGYFGNPLRNKCEQCVYPCKECTSIQACLSCSYGFYYDVTGECLSLCPAGYYPNYQTRACHKCSSPCQNCANTNLQGSLALKARSFSRTSCLTCQPGFSLALFTSLIGGNAGWEGGLCLPQCPNNHYQYLDHSLNISYCLQCAEECLTCTSLSVCSSCSTGYFLNDELARCTSSCPPSTYQNELARQCTPCPTQCQTCTSTQICAQCRYPYSFFSLSHSCLVACPPGYYSSLAESDDSSGGICLLCSPPCRTCLSSSQCLSCSSLFLLDTTCVQVCDVGFYPDSKTLECLLCPTKCKSCSAADFCHECVEGYMFVPVVSTSMGQCVDECPSGMYSDAGICVECSLQCSECRNNSFCTGCAVGLILDTQTGRCLQQCGQGYYYQLLSSNQTLSGQCSKCMENCSSCQQNSAQELLCLKCQAGSYLSVDSLQCWFEGCPEGQYVVADSHCHLCSPPCSQCLSQTLCLSCQPGMGYFLSNSPQINGSGGVCVSQCPGGYYQMQTEKFGFICESCPFSCLACMSANASSVVCLECQQNYFLTNNLQCVDSCDDWPATYADQITQRCQPCSSKCLQCYGSSLNCSTCTSPYVLSIQAGSGTSECVSVCPDGTYAATQTINNNSTITDILYCSSCALNCSVCVSELLCLICNSQSYLLFVGDQESQCVSDCGSLMFENQGTGLCSSCSYPCVQCLSALECLSCVEGLFLSPEKECVRSCHYGTYLGPSSDESLVCEDCPQHCSECVSDEQCLSCSDGWVLVAATCVKSCPEAMYDTGFGTCMPCMYGCTSCDTGYTCKECVTGFLFEGECRKFCPYGLVAVQEGSTQTCVPCDDSCLTCSVSPTQCLSCYANSLLYISMCVQECPSGHYPSDIEDISQGGRKCLTCTNPCQTCSNAYSCDSCMYGYILYMEKGRNQCVPSSICPNGYYLDIKQNFCKIQCQQEEYVLESSRRCYTIGQCPIGYAHSIVYDSLRNTTTKSCVLQCPAFQSSQTVTAWSDYNRYCQTTSEDITLPKMACQLESIRNILVGKCHFNVDMDANQLSEFTAQNFQVLYSKDKNFDEKNIEESLVSHLNVFDVNINSPKQLTLILSPQQFQSELPIQEQLVGAEDQDNSKLQNIWVNIGIRPRFSLQSKQNYEYPADYLADPDSYFSSQSAENSTRLLQEVRNQRMLLQEADSKVFLVLFNFYTPSQRQIGVFLFQLAASISLVLAIIWFFALVRNKPIYSSMGMTALQWLYLLSICPSTHLPPNLQQFLEGFKSSMLMFFQPAKNNFSTQTNFLWSLEGFRGNIFEEEMAQNRYQLFDVTDLSDFNVLGIPIVIFISFFGFVYVVLTALKAIVKHYLFVKIQKNQTLSTSKRRRNKNIQRLSSSSSSSKKSRIQNKIQQMDDKNSSSKSRSSDSYKNEDSQKVQKPRNFLKAHENAIGLLKKVKILQKRFNFNYLHHMTCLIAIPVYTVLLVQLISPTTIPFIAALALFALVAVVAAHARMKLYPIEDQYCKIDEQEEQQSKNSLGIKSVEGLIGAKKLKALNKTRGISRYLVSTIILHFLSVCLAVISTDFTLCLGGMAILFLLQLQLCKYIFEFNMDWRMYSFLILALFKLLILVILFIVHASASVWSSAGVFWIGWIGVGAIVSYVLAISVFMARDLFEGASSRPSRNKKHQKNKALTIKSRKQQTQNSEEGQEQEAHSVEKSNQNEEDFYDLDDYMESYDDFQAEEESFFEDVEYLPGETESEGSASEDIIDFSEQSSEEKQRRKVPQQIFTYGFGLNAVANADLDSNKSEKT